MTNEMWAFSVLAGLLLVIALAAFACVQVLAVRWRLAHDRPGARPVVKQIVEPASLEQPVGPANFNQMEDELAELLRRDEIARKSIENPVVTYVRSILISAIREELTENSGPQSPGVRNQVKAS